MKPIALQEVLSAFETGKRPKGGAVDQGVPSLGGEHVTAESTLKLTGMKFVPTDFFDSMHKGHVQRGDVLVVKDGATTGRVGMVEPGFPFERAAVNEHVFLLRADRRQLEPQFLYFYLRSGRGQAELMSDFRGAAQGGISREIGTKVRIPLPTLGEQQRIVDLLARAESIVRLRRQAQEKTAALVPAIFVDMFGDPATNPKGWPVKHLGDLLSVPIRNGISPSKSGTVPGRVLTLSAITQGRFDAGAVKEANFAVPIAGGDEVRAVDFLVCRGNGNRTLVGAGCYPTHDMSGVAFPDTAIAVRPDPTLLNRAYFSALWGTAFIRRQIDSIAKTTNGTFKINQTGLAGVRVLVPAPEVQGRFARLAEALQSIQSQQAIALEKAVATFDALLARAFTAQSAADAIHEAERVLA